MTRTCDTIANPAPRRPASARIPWFSGLSRVYTWGSGSSAHPACRLPAGRPARSRDAIAMTGASRSSPAGARSGNIRATRQSKIAAGAIFSRDLVEAPGIENGRGRRACTIPRREGTIVQGRKPGSVSSRASECAIVGGVGTESSRASRDEYELRDVVEPALARALVLAAEAHRWDLAAQIATELAARRRTREGKAPIEKIGHRNARAASALEASAAAHSGHA